jgi:hypothetical protein
MDRAIEGVVLVQQFAGDRGGLRLGAFDAAQTGFGVVRAWRVVGHWGFFAQTSSRFLVATSFWVASTKSSSVVSSGSGWSSSTISASGAR